MITIRRLTYFDVPKIKKMISYLGNDDKISRTFTVDACALFQSVLPLKYKFIPESYILLEEKEIIGLITVVPTSGNPYKLNITRLIFKQNRYEVGKQLVDFVIAKFGAQGAHSFIVAINQSHDELLQLFMQECGFRHCSYENLWKLDNYKSKTTAKATFRYCQNNDAKYVARLYNAELKNLYRPSLERAKSEYTEPLFAGFSKDYKNRYVLEEPEKQKIIAYLSITTNDNYNFIIDLSLNNAYNISYEGVINFALSEISNKKSNYCAFLKHRQYTKNADDFEKYLHEKKLECIQTKCVLVKDYYKPIKQTDNALQVFQFGEFSSN